MSLTVSELLAFLRDKNPSAKVVVSLPAHGREAYIIDEELQEMPLTECGFATLSQVTLTAEPNQIWPRVVPVPPKPSKEIGSGEITKGG